MVIIWKEKLYCSNQQDERLMVALSICLLAFAIVALVVTLSPWAVNEYDKLMEKEEDNGDN